MGKTLDLNLLFPEPREGLIRGPLPKQQEVMNLCMDPDGARFISYVGGYGCLAGSTLINTKTGDIRIDAITPGTYVLTTLGYAQVNCSFPKGRAKLFRVKHSGGEFSAYESHLTYVSGRGYLPVSDLNPGDQLSSFSLPETTSESFPEESHLNALHWMQTTVDCLGHYSEYYHRYGQLPQSAVDNVQSLFPLLNDALGSYQHFSHKDDLPALAQLHNRRDQLIYLLTNYRSMCLSVLREVIGRDCTSSLASAQTSADIQLSEQFDWKSVFHHTIQLLGSDRAPVVGSSSYEVLSIVQDTTESDYFDMGVLSTGHYVLTDGTIHHNSGKSLILCVINIIWGIVHGGEYVIARQFMPELRRTTYKLFKELLPKDLILEDRIADAEIKIKSIKGTATFYFVGLDSPDKLDSLNLSGASIDESSQTTEEAMLKLQGRIRNPKGLRKMFFAGNPRGHNYIYQYFVKQDQFKTFTDPVTNKMITAESQKQQYHLVVAPSTENKHLPPGYIAQMMASYSQERIQRDIMGSFDVFEGMVYTEFSRAMHVIRPFDIPADWTRVIGCDHGYSNPAAWVYAAIDYDGNMYVYREYYQREKLIAEISKENLQLMGYNPVTKVFKEEISMAIFDPSITAQRNERNGAKYSDRDIYLENLPNSFPMVLGNNDVNAGIDKMKSYLKPNEKTGKPRLYFFDTCPETIAEVSQYQWEELSPGQQGRTNEKEKPRKYNDHAVDALRYLIMSRPDEPKAEDLRAKLRQQPTLVGSVMRELHDIKHKGSNKYDTFKDYEYGQDPGWSDPY